MEKDMAELIKLGIFAFIAGVIGVAVYAFSTAIIHEIL